MEFVKVTDRNIDWAKQILTPQLPSSLKSTDSHIHIPLAWLFSYLQAQLATNSKKYNYFSHLCVIVLECILPKSVYSNALDPSLSSLPLHTRHFLMPEG